MKLNSYSDLRTLYKVYRLASVLRCGTGTVRVLLKGLRGHSQETQVTIMTFSIFPELTRLWYYFMDKTVRVFANEGYTTNLIIVDCSGKLDPCNFPSAIIEKFINHIHPWKLDFFFNWYIKSKLVFICDDDCFVLNPKVVVKAANNMINDGKLAVYSFFPRPDWWFIINGERIRPMGSYCLIVNRDIIIKEKLSFQSPKIPNPYNNNKIYDTADYMNEQLLKRGYKIKLPERQERSTAIGGFRGASACKILEWGCSRNELITYFRKPFSYEYHLRHNLKSFYIAARVIRLYNYVFNAEVKPLFNEIELWKFVEQIPNGELKKGIMQDLEWVDRNYQQLVKVLNASKSQ